MRRQEEKGEKESMDEREKRKIKKKKGKAGEKRREERWRDGGRMGQKHVVKRQEQHHRGLQ